MLNDHASEGELESSTGGPGDATTSGFGGRWGTLVNVGSGCEVGLIRQISTNV